jgi:hypothetical protein
MLERHPDLQIDDRGAARVFGQLAFGSAALGRRADAVRWARRTLGRSWREPRALLALAVATRLLRAETVMSFLHRRGKGL